MLGTINILTRGYRVLACGEPVLLSCSVKQPPPEVSQRTFMPNAVGIYLIWCGENVKEVARVRVRRAHKLRARDLLATDRVGRCGRYLFLRRVICAVRSAWH